MKKHSEIEIDLDELLSHMNENGALPDPDTLQFYQMHHDRKMWIDMQVDASAVGYLRMIHLWNAEDKDKPVEDRKPIRIYLQNYGGDGDMMWMLLDAIVASKTPIYTINVGVAASAASLIFIAGHKRYMMKNARVVIHEGSAGFSGDAVKVLDQTDSYRKELKRMKEFILAHTEIPPATLNKKRNNDWDIDATYCLEHKVCDFIVEDLDTIV